MRLMAWVAVHMGRPVARLLLHPVTLYFLCCAPAARRNSARYLARALGRRPSWRERYGHLHAFAATVLDRVYFVCDRLDQFELQLSGTQLVDEMMAQGHGAFLLGAHIGSFEALHAIGVNIPKLRVAMAMYPENARNLHNVLAALAPDFKLGIIPIGQRGSTLAIRDWLDGGGLVGLLGDRHLPAEGTRAGDGGNTGGTSSLLLPFLGVPTLFSDGPLRLAMLLRRKVIFMVGLYKGGRRYDLRFSTLADFSTPPADAAERERQLHAALHDYVARLEALCRELPDNWFNFHDYWHEDAAA